MVQGADCPRSCSRSGGWRGASGQSKQSPCPPQQLHFPSTLLLPLTLCASPLFPSLPPPAQNSPIPSFANVRSPLCIRTGERHSTRPTDLVRAASPYRPLCWGDARQRSPVPVPRGQDPHMTTMSRMICAGLGTQVRCSGSTGEALNTLKPPLYARYCSRY